MRVYLLALVSTISICLSAQNTYIVQPLCDALEAEVFAARSFNNQIYVINYENDSLRRVTGNKSFTEISLLTDCALQPATLFSAKHQMNIPISSLKHDGPISASKDGNLLFFSNNSDSKLGLQMGIFFLEKSDSGWSEAIALPYNSEKYSCIHPFYDQQNQKLYFASNMPDKTNPYSIYAVEFNGDSFGEPKPVNAINSPFNEVFPSVYNDVLYFTSDRMGGHGGMDIYQYAGDSIHLMPYPINSSYDDLAYFQINNNNAFVSSNRHNAGASDQTLFVRIKTPNQNQQLVAENSATDTDLQLNPFKQQFLQQNNTNLQQTNASNSRITINKSAEELINSSQQMQQQINTSKTELANNWSSFSEELEALLFNESIEGLKEKIALEEEIRNLISNLNAASFEEKNAILDELIGKLKTYDPELAQQLLPRLNEIKSTYQEQSEQLALIEDKNQAIKDLAILALRQQAMENNLSLEEFAIQNQQKIQELGLTLSELTEHKVGKYALQQIVNNSQKITFLFEFDSYKVNNNYKQTLLDLINLTLILEGVEIQIEGHTDNTGSPQYNMLLSERRALAIKKQLVNNGLPANMFNVKFFGIHQPKFDNKTKRGRKLNRRVEIKLIVVQE